MKYEQTFYSAIEQANFNFILAVIYGILYLVFNLYLVVHMAVFMGYERLGNVSVSIRINF